jgi:acetyltransferase-like isoleucine patch superfamily enzyme
MREDKEMIEHLLKRTGHNLRIAANVELIRPENIEIGDNVWIGSRCYIDGAGGLEIGNDVGIEPGVMILTSVRTGIPESIPLKDTPLKYQKLVIKDGEYIVAGTVMRLVKYE